MEVEFIGRVVVRRKLIRGNDEPRGDLATPLLSSRLENAEILNNFYRRKSINESCRKLRSLLNKSKIDIIDVRIQGIS